MTSVTREMNMDRRIFKFVIGCLIGGAYGRLWAVDREYSWVGIC